MPDVFDPYREWLGLEFSGTKPDYYELLGLRRGEQDPQHIQQAAERATIRVRSHRPGAQAADWARVLDEIQAAKNCLLDPQERAAYDRNLPASAGGAAPTPAPGAWGPALPQPQGSAPPVSSAPRMEMQVTQPQRDLLPPRPAAPAERVPNPAVTAPAPAATMPTTPAPVNPAPLVSQAIAAPMNPAPYAAPTAPPAGVPALSGYTSTVANSSWNPAPAMPVAAWGAPQAMPAPAAQPWGPMAMAPSYGYGPPPADPMAPATYGAPMAPAMPAAYAQPAYPQPVYAQPGFAQPGAMDPMAPTYGGAPAYSSGPPGPTMYGAAGAMPAPYAPADPMQPLSPPSAAYHAASEAALPMAALPMAAAESYAAPQAYSLGIGPPQSAIAPTAVASAVPTGVAAPVGAALPVSANTPIALPAKAAPNENEVSIRATRSRRGGNLWLLAGAGGGAALLLLAVGMVFMNQPREPVVAHNPPVAPTPNSKGPQTPSSNLDSSDMSPTKPSTPPSRVEPPQPEPMPTPAESAKPEPTPTPEPAKPEPPKPESAKPETPRPPAKPTREQLEALSKLLQGARQALREANFEEAQAKLAEAEPLPKTEDQAVIAARLEQLTMHAAAYREAFEQGKEKLSVGQTLVVTASTQPEIVELDADKIAISNKGEKRSYEWKSLPQGLFYAIADSAFEPGDVQQKVQRGAYVIALANDEKDAEKGKALWQEAIDGGAPLTQLLPVIGDKYELANLEMVAKVEPPETKPATPVPPKTETPSPKPNANSTAALPLLKQARDEIGGHQFSEAQALLAKAAPLLANDDQQAKHTRLTLLLDYTKQFKDAIDRTLGRLESGNTFEVGKTVVAVVEVRPREVVVRVNGTNRTYQRAEMPIGMAVALGDMSLQKDSPEAKLVRGAYVIACSSKPDDIEKAKEWWREAAGRVDVKTLLPVIDDTYTR